MKHRMLITGLTGFACCILTWSRLSDGDELKPNAAKTRRPEGSTDKPASKLTSSQTELVNKVFSGRLLEIAAEYKQYERVDQTIRWSPARCRAPSPKPENLASISSSGLQTPHGKKLYYLYARKPYAYRGNVWGLSTDSGEVRAPLGQVLVKEAWKPIKSESTEDQDDDVQRNAKKNRKEERVAYAIDGGVRYHAGAKKGLFIMFKTLETTPGTDRGWVYGTVSADGRRVTSVGLVKNCMQCHEEARFDRQIGLSTIGK